MLKTRDNGFNWYHVFFIVFKRRLWQNYGRIMAAPEGAYRDCGKFGMRSSCGTRYGMENGVFVEIPEKINGAPLPRIEFCHNFATPPRTGEQVKGVTYERADTSISLPVSSPLFFHTVPDEETEKAPDIRTTQDEPGL